MLVGSQRHAPAALPPGMTRCPLYKRLGGAQDRSGRMRKLSSPPEFDPRSSSPLTSRYTYYSILHTSNKSYPFTDLDRLRGLQEDKGPSFSDNQQIKVLRLSVIRISRLYIPWEILGTHFS